MDGDGLLQRLNEFEDRTAICWNGRDFSYGEILDRVGRWQEELVRRNIQPGQCVALAGDFSVGTTTLLFALVANRNIAIPLTASVLSAREQQQRSVYANWVFRFDADDRWEYDARTEVEDHPLLCELRDRGESGLVLFSSGSTGQAKASLHSFPRLLTRFGERRRAFRMLTFLLLDHMGGINTLLSIFCNGGTAVTVPQRSAEAVCQAVQDYRVELLPATPTFLNMLLISEAYKRYDFSSIEIISYGTEPMPAATLEALRDVFPGVKFRQLYGLTELGILPTRTNRSNALMVQLGGEGCEVKVVDGTLRIRADTAMLGYLNAPSPFDDDGWFDTGDVVVIEDGYMRILGRESEMINVGGEKVIPSEIENLLLRMDNVRDVAIWGKPNPITGYVVAARVALAQPEEPKVLQRRVREFCRGRLAPYKIPAVVEIAQDDLHGERFKKMRQPG